VPKWHCASLFINDLRHFILEVGGLDAVRICEENSEIDIVLMDLKLPLMTGIEATKKIKKIRPELPIIAQTAYAFSEDKKVALQAGCDGFITKPIDNNVLLETVMEHLNKKNA